jgi:hypothetical protein
VWFIPGMLLATGYFVYTYRSFSGKVKVRRQIPGTARPGVAPGEDDG